MTAPNTFYSVSPIEEGKAVDIIFVVVIEHILHNFFRSFQPILAAPEIAGGTEGAVVRTAATHVQSHKVGIGSPVFLGGVQITFQQTVVPLGKSFQVAQRDGSVIVQDLTVRKTEVSRGTMVFSPSLVQT